MSRKLILREARTVSVTSSSSSEAGNGSAIMKHYHMITYIFPSQLASLIISRGKNSSKIIS